VDKDTRYELPVGYFNFHKKQIYNFQYNRWHSVGFARYKDLLDISKRINSFGDWKKVWIEHAEKAEAEGRLKNAAIYYRAAEFYITQDDPDKINFYDKFIELFYKVFKEDNLESFKVPYDKSYLHSFKVPVKKKL